MNCEQIHDRTIDFIYGELSPQDRSAFELHMAGCVTCARDVESLARAREVAKAAVTGPLLQDAPGRVRAAVMQAVRADRPFRSAPSAGVGFGAWLRKPWFIPVFAAAGAFAVLLVARTSITDLEPVMPRAKVAAPTGAPAAPVVAVPEFAKEAEAPNDDKPLGKRQDDDGLAREGRGAGSGPQLRKAPTPLTARARDEDRWAAPPPSRAVARNERPAAEGLAGLRAPEKKKAVAEVDSVADSVAVRESLADNKGNVAALGAVGRAKNDQNSVPRVGQSPSRLSAQPEPAAGSPAPASVASESAAVGGGAGAAAKAESSRAQADLPRLETLVLQAERAMIEARWADAVTAYTELLRRFPRHDKSAGWRLQQGRARTELRRNAAGDL